MIDKILSVISFKKIIIILLSIIVALIIIFAIKKNHQERTPFKEPQEECIFKLKGDEEITLKYNEEYEELGFLAETTTNKDISDFVKIENSVDEDIAGIYKIKYKLIYNNCNETLYRSVIVSAKEEEEEKDKEEEEEKKEIEYDIKLKLKGDEKVYLNIDEIYEELGATAYYGGTNISSNIEIENGVIDGVQGNYKVLYYVEYKNKKVEIERDVVILNIDDYFKVDEKNKKIIVTVTDDIKAVITPNKLVNYKKVIEYPINKSTEYEFQLYTPDLKKYTKTIKVKITDEDKPPQGVCIATVKGSSTSFVVTSLDNDIVTYNYNGIATTKNSSFTTNSSINKNAYVILTDLAGNMTKIDCNIKYAYLDVIKPKNDENTVYKSESSTLKVYVSKKDGFYITRVWAANANRQLRKQVVNSKKVVKPITLFKDAINENNLSSKIMVGFNASGIVTKDWYSSLISKNSAYNYMEPISLIVTNGKVTLNDYQKYSADYPIYYINSKNQLSYIPRIKSKSASERKKIFQNAIDDGAYNTFGFTNKVAVENYKANDISFSGDYNARRQGICQIDTNNFIVVTSNTKTMWRGDYAKYLQSLGCKTAFNLDGGGSTTLMYKNANGTPMTLTGGSRPMQMILYFTES